MSRNIKLKDAVQIMSGYTFRTALPEGKNGNIAVVQAKNIVPGVPITQETELTKVTLEQKASNAIVQDGDVLLVSRGTMNGGFKATVVKGAVTTMITASSVFVLRPNLEILNSGYLALYLNSEVGQESLRRIASGSNILSLLVSELHGLPITLPPLSTQSTLASTYENVTAQLNLILKHETLLRGVLSIAVKSVLQP